LYDNSFTTTQTYNITVGSTTMEVYCIQNVDSGGWTVCGCKYLSGKGN